MIDWEKARNHLAAADPVLARLMPLYSDRLEASPDAFRTLANAIVGQQISVKAAASIWARLNERLSGTEQSFAGTFVGTELVTDSEFSSKGGRGLSPASILAATEENLRACGLSSRKVEYLRGIARAFAEDRLAAAEWPELSDEQMLSRLVGLRGIGRWTAEMFLIFHLERPDLLPLDDIGLLRAAGEQYGWFDELRREREAPGTEPPFVGTELISRPRSSLVGTELEKSTAGNGPPSGAIPAIPTKTKESQLRRDYREVARRLEAHAEIWRPYRTVATWYLWRWLDVEPVVY